MKDETAEEKRVRTRRQIVPRETRAIFVLEAMRLLPKQHQYALVYAALQDEWCEADHIHPGVEAAPVVLLNERGSSRSRFMAAA